MTIKTKYSSFRDFSRDRYPFVKVRTKGEHKRSGRYLVICQIKRTECALPSTYWRGEKCLGIIKKKTYLFFLKVSTSNKNKEKKNFFYLILIINPHKRTRQSSLELIDIQRIIIVNRSWIYISVLPIIFAWRHNRLVMLQQPFNCEFLRKFYSCISIITIG